MISLKKDGNRVTTLGVTSSADGVSVVQVLVSPTTHKLKVDIGDTGISVQALNASRDANRQPVMWGVSSADLETPIPIYSHNNGHINIKIL